MKEIKLYACEHCQTNYADKRKAEQCENNHKTSLKIIKTRYVPITSDQGGFPVAILVKSKDGAER